MNASLAALGPVTPGPRASQITASHACRRRLQPPRGRPGDGCDQPITRAEPLEEQLVDWITDFKPDEELRTTILASIRSAANGADDDAPFRRELVGQLERLRDLYVMGSSPRKEARCQKRERRDSNPRPPA